jgi:hypothetical protein
LGNTPGIGYTWRVQTCTIIGVIGWLRVQVSEEK